MNMKELGMKLLRAESEAEVAAIVDVDPVMSDASNWRAVDDRDTNFNIVKNQSSTGGKAATELITNMVDAVLMKRCLEEGIDPKGQDAPATMYKAVDAFIQNLNGGRIIDADDDWLLSYARENLIIGVTAVNTRVKPCYTFADNGEGQHPDDFPSTFLSLSKKNKSQIPFVQGKYNMGSSGVLGFCGTRWFKLIVSRRFDKSGGWGWTLVKKHSGDADQDVYAEYFAPQGKIPTLGDLQILLPFQTKGGKEFNQFSLDAGTVVKVYDFYVGKDFKGFYGSREAFNENLVETILPFRIYDFRWPASANRSGLRALGVDERTFYGMEFLLRRAHSDVNAVADDLDGHDTVEADSKSALHVATIEAPNLGRIVLSAIPIKKPKVSKKKTWFQRSKNRVFHHVNGQVHFKRPRGFLTQCGLQALKDRVVIFVDASALKDVARQDIWKSDREQIFDSPTGEEYKSEVQKAISESPVLKELNHRVAREELATVVEDISRDVVGALIKRDPNLALLLDESYPQVQVPGDGVPNPQPPVNFSHQYSPSFIKFATRKLDIELPINRKRPIPCITDVNRDYFIRASNQGHLHFEKDETADMFSFRANFDEIGNLVVFVTPNAQQLRVGDVHEFKIGLYDDAMPEPVYTDVAIRITVVKKQPPRPPPPPVPVPDPKPKVTSKGLPRVRLLTKKGRKVLDKDTVRWDDPLVSELAFTEQDGGFVQDLGEGKIYNINCDNQWFINYLGHQKRADQKSAATHKYILGMQIMMLGLEIALAKEQPEEDDAFDTDKFRRLASKGVAAAIMSLCQLPESFDSSGDAGDADDE